MCVNCLDGQRVFSDILLCLDDLKHRPSHETNENINFLKYFLEAPHVWSLLQIYEKLEGHDTFFVDFTSNGLDLVYEIYNDITLRPCISPEANELARVFQNPHFQALITAHDQVTSKLYEKYAGSDMDEVMDANTKSIRIVRLVKEEQEPLGITVRHCPSKGCCIITRIFDGGTASRSGVLEVGDEICEINGVSVQGSRIEDILTLLHFSSNSLSLKVVPALEIIRTFPRENKVFHVKCHFAYNPRNDPLLPCQEAGLAFGRNEILHVFDRTDTWWWQARKVGCSSEQTGLIPSQILQERRLYKANLEKALRKKCVHNETFDTIILARAKRKKFKKTKIIYSSNCKNDFETVPVLAYEEVIKLTPLSHFPRPVVLVGPRFVGRNELRRLLISSDPERFMTPVNYPPRKQLDEENNNNIFGDSDLEEPTSWSPCRSFTTEHQGDFERISIHCVKTLMNSGKCCVIVIPPQELAIVRTRELLPYVVFVKPPSLQRLRQTRLMSRVKSSSLQNRKVFTVTELQDMIMKAEEIEHRYRHCFDLIIVNDDLQDAYDRLYTAAYLVAKEPQWIPVNWLW